MHPDDIGPIYIIILTHIYMTQLFSELGKLLIFEDFLLIIT